MKIEKSYSENRAILITENQLKYLDQYLSNNFKEVQYDVTCNDDTKIDFDNLNDLLAYENPDFRKIVILNITCRNLDSSIKDLLLISLGSKYDSKTAEYFLRSSNIDKVGTLVNELESRFKNFRPWYWLISKYSLTTIIPVIILLISIAANAFNVYNRSVGMKNQSEGLSMNLNESIAIGFIIFGIIIAICWLLDKIKNVIFPKKVFSIGSQKNRQSKKVYILNLIFGVIFLGVIVSMLGTYLYELVTE